MVAVLLLWGVTATAIPIAELNGFEIHGVAKRAVAGGSVSTALGSLFLYFWSRRRSRRALQRANLMLCPGCRYPLLEVNDHVQCPECGCGFSKQEIASIWRSAYRKL
jgi:hypothetical protein